VHLSDSRKQRRAYSPIVISLCCIVAVVLMKSDRAFSELPRSRQIASKQGLSGATSKGVERSLGFRRDLIKGSLMASVLPSVKVEAAENDDLLATFTVNLQGNHGGTDKVVVRLRPDWAPRGVRRFKQLVRMNNFEDSAVFFENDRVSMFGLPSEATIRPDVIRDDLNRAPNKRGTLVFAQEQGRQHSRRDKLIFNTKDNKHLDHQGYAPIGEVVEGMDVVDKFYDEYTRWPDMDRIIEEGNAYLDAEYPKLTKIQAVELNL